jgi:NAD(P)H-nitrite reductase large subunit
MTALHHVLVGSGIAALSAAEAIRSADPRARITMVSLEDAPFYSRPGLAYLLTNELPEAALEIRSAAELAALRLERVTGMASRIDTGERRLVLQDGRRIGYDRLLIATGASSMPPDFPGAALDGVVQVDGLSEARDFVARSRRASTAIVVGGGSTALELVDGLHARGVTTHYLLRGDRYWSRSSIRSSPRSSRRGSSRTASSSTASPACASDRHQRCAGGGDDDGGTTLACDLLAVAVGVRPRLELARASGVAIDRGILTNEYLETSVTGVFAAGDAAQVYDR